MKTKTYSYIKCPVAGCTEKPKNMAGLSAHFRASLNGHPALWKGNLKESLEALGITELHADTGEVIAPPTRVQSWKGKKAKSKANGGDKLPRPTKSGINEFRAPRGEINFCPRCAFDLRPVLIGAAVQVKPFEV